MRPRPCTRRDLYVQLAVMLGLVLGLVFNDAALMRALFLVLLVPLVADIQRRLWHAAQRTFADNMLACAELAGAKYREEQQQHEG
ncbi:MAG TPA: hypothetical protein VLA19_06610 [Herpetosiphonaceae bacterium]|nr:hypothetical protein [Herpetosiphonaceae bacterium]